MVNLLADQGFGGEPFFVSDMDRCMPGSALSRDPLRRHWRLMDYEAEGLSGTMLTAGPETAAPEITCPLGISGYHAISIGTYVRHGLLNVPVSVLARLSGDEQFSLLSMPPQEERGAIVHELFWKVADLTGQDIVIGQAKNRVAPGEGPGSYLCTNARVAYVKLVPLSDREVDALEADRRRRDTRRLFAHNDGWSLMFAYRPTTPEELCRDLAPLEDSDFSRLYWEAGGGDMLQYYTKIGRLHTYENVGDFSRPGERFVGESWRAFREQGIDPFRVAIDHTHTMGLEFHAGYRVSNFRSPPPQDYLSVGDSFYSRHPELRGVTRAGEPTPRIAYSYPETRRYVVSIFREMASYPIDGVCLMYNRRPPFVEYEPPLVEGFKTRHGLDPRALDETDPRWLSHRAGAMTQFMRELRAALDDAAQEHRRDRRIGVTAIVMRDVRENLEHGLDLETWLAEDLVDTLVPYSSEPNYDAFYESANESWPDVSDAGHFVNLTRGTGCTLALNLLPRRMGVEQYRRKAATLYGAGVENFFIWDTNLRSDYGAAWGALRRLGHRDEIAAWARAGEPPMESPGRLLSSLGGFGVGYETPE